MRWLALLAGLLLVAPAAAQEWPSRNIRVVVPYPAGGPADFMGRLAAQKLQEKLGVSVVVENRSGASGTIGAETVRQSPPDGYTFLAAPVVHILGRLVVKAVPYDPIGDFTAIVRYGEGPLIVLANPGAVPGKTLAEALPAIKSKPNDFRFGISALGSPNHLAVLEFNRLTKLNLQIIPYRGSAPALTDLVSGQVQLMIDPMITALPLVSAGQLKALAVAAAAAPRCFPTSRPLQKAGWPALSFPPGTACGGRRDCRRKSSHGSTPCCLNPCASPPSSKSSQRSASSRSRQVHLKNFLPSSPATSRATPRCSTPSNSNRSET